MRVLIIGGMGVIGAEVSRKFVQEGHRPVIFARHRDESLIGDLLDKVEVELGDITDMASLLHAIKKHRVTHVIHAGGLVSNLAHANPSLGVQVNVAGTVNVLEAARLFDIQRVVYTSAKGVYGPFTGEYGHSTFKPVPEDHPKNPTRLYDCLKFMAENACDYYRATYGVDVVCLRFGTTYGPGKSARHGTMGVTSRIVEDPFYGHPFHLPKGGDQKDDFIYNKDSALGVYLASVTEKLESHAFNIGTGVGLTLKDFARVMRQHFPDAQMEIGPGLGFFAYPHPMYAVFDISRAQKELGYRPRFDLEAAIDDYLETLRRMQRQRNSAAMA